MALNARGSHLFPDPQSVHRLCYLRDIYYFHWEFQLFMYKILLLSWVVGSGRVGAMA